jgi:hypothetical protein
VTGKHRHLSFESSGRFQFSFTDFSLVYRSAIAQIFLRSQPMRESNTKLNYENVSHVNFVTVVFLFKRNIILIQLK